jgi:hypothetical protein
MSICEYLLAVKQRNKETHADGHEVVFNYNECLIDEHKAFFNWCFDNNLSPHKALLYFYDEIL